MEREGNDWGKVFGDEFFDHVCAIDGDLIDFLDQEFMFAVDRVLGKIDSYWPVPASKMKSTDVDWCGRSVNTVVGNFQKIVKTVEIARTNVERAEPYANIYGYQGSAVLYQNLNDLYNTLLVASNEQIQLGADWSRDTRKEIGKRTEDSARDNNAESWVLVGNLTKAMEVAENASSLAKTSVESAENAKALAEGAKKAAEEARNQAVKDAKDAVEKVNALMPNMLTTLGIFVAIIIAVVAAYLSSILAQSSAGGNTTVFHTVLLCCLLGHVLLNVLFLFIYLISKMNDLPLACYCFRGKTRKCNECKGQSRCHLANRLWRRYPYVLSVNILFATVYCVLGIWYVVSTYIGGEIDRFFANNVPHTLWLAVVLTLFCVAALIVVSCLFIHGKKPREGEVSAIEELEARIAKLEEWAAKPPGNKADPEEIKVGAGAGQAEETR